MAFHIIEDDAPVADALALMLRAFGHDVHLYPDAEAFLSAPLPGRTDTVVVDLGLPGMSGADLVRRLRADAAGLRIVVVTGQRQPRLASELDGAGAVRVIRKPVDADALRDLV